MAILLDDGTVADLANPEKGEPVCAGPPKDGQKVGEKRGRRSRSRGSSDEADSDFGSLDFDLKDAVDTVLGKPMSAHRAARLVASGSLLWLSDPVTVPPTGNETLAAVVKDPTPALANSCIFDEVVGVRLLALLIDDIEAAKNDEDNPHDVFPGNTVATLAVVFEGAKRKPLKRIDVLTDAFVRQTRALGRRARMLRETLRARAKDATNEETKAVPDARAPGGMTDPATYVRRERVEDLVNSIDQEGEIPQLLSLEDAEKDPDFVIGAVLAGCAFDADTSARGLWRAVTAHDRHAAASVRKDHREEIKAARERKRDEVTAAAAARSALQAVRQAAPGGGGAGSGGASAGSSPTGSTGTSTRTGASLKRQSARQRRQARQRAAAAAAAGSTGDGGSGGAAGAASGNGADPALSLPPSKRDDAVVARLRLCRRCRRTGHMERDCRNDAVSFDG